MFFFFTEAGGLGDLNPALYCTRTVNKAIEDFSRNTGLNFSLPLSQGYEVIL